MGVLKLNTKLLTIIVVVVLVAAGLYFSSSDRVGDGAQNSGGNSGEENNAPGIGIAGEVALSLPGEQKTLNPDLTPPDFFIKRSGKDAVTLAELKGKPVFINFWYTGCTFCRAEMPDLNKLYREYGENVEFIFLNYLPMEKSVQDVTKFLSDNGYSIPVYLDRQGEVTRTYGVNGFPATLVLNGAGEIVYAAAGQISYEKAKSLLTK